MTLSASRWHSYTAQCCWAWWWLTQSPSDRWIAAEAADTISLNLVVCGAAADRTPPQPLIRKKSAVSQHLMTTCSRAGGGKRVQLTTTQLQQESWRQSCAWLIASASRFPFFPLWESHIWAEGWWRPGSRPGGRVPVGLILQGSSAEWRQVARTSVCAEKND